MAKGMSSVGKLRRNFVLATTAALLATLAVLCIVVVATFNSANTMHADSVINILHDNDGQFPRSEKDRRPSMFEPFSVSVETPHETRYAVAHVSADGAVVSIDAKQIAMMNTEELSSLVLQAQESGRQRGYLGYYRYAVFPADDGSGEVEVILIDCYLRQQATLTVLAISIVGSLSCTVLVLLFLIPFSKRAVRPFVRNLERQQRFVTDASHELKTPLAIISANNELTERLSGETQWTRSTKTQVARLNTLIRDLIDMARASEASADEQLPVVDASELVQRSVDDFMPLAEAAGKQLEATIAPGLQVRGNGESLERLLGVLLDNAVKHGDEAGPISVKVGAHRKNVLISVANPAASLGEQEVAHLFDRFYRADSSRSRSTGGYGIGLSVAEGIAERHGGKIVAEKEGSSLVLTVTLPRSE